MMSHYLSFLVRRWRAVLLLVAAMSLNPGRACAECGNYITIHNPASETHLAPSMLPTHDRLALNELGNSTPSKLPCRGPNCSSIPVRESPPLAPVIPFSSHIKKLVQCPAWADDEAARSSSFACDDTSLPPSYRASSVFHPPRFG